MTFLRLKGVSPRIGDYHRTGIEPDTVPALMREQAAALDSSRQLIYFAVKTLEPEISVSDINYPSKRLHGTFGLSAAPACVKVIAEEEVFRRQGQ